MKKYNIFNLNLVSESNTLKISDLVESHVKAIKYMTNEDDANQALRDGVGTSTREHGHILQQLHFNEGLQIYSSDRVVASSEVRLPEFMTFGLNLECELTFPSDSTVDAASHSVILVGYDSNGIGVVWARLSTADPSKKTSFGAGTDRFIRTFVQNYDDIVNVPTNLHYEVHLVSVAGDDAIDLGTMAAQGDTSTLFSTVTELTEKTCLLPKINYSTNSYHEITFTDKDKLEIYAIETILTSNKPFNIYDPRIVIDEVATSKKYIVADREESFILLSDVPEANMDGDSPLVKYLNTFRRAITNMMRTSLD